MIFHGSNVAKLLAKIFEICKAQLSQQSPLGLSLVHVRSVALAPAELAALRQSSVLKASSQPCTGFAKGPLLGQLSFANLETLGQRLGCYIAVKDHLARPNNSTEASLRVEDCLSAASSADTKEASVELLRLKTTRSRTAI